HAHHPDLHSFPTRRSSDLPPALVEMKRGGKVVPAVAQLTKMGLLFILERDTGKPVFGVEERPVPRADTPGEESWPTEPFPLKPPDRKSTRLNSSHSQISYA